MKNGTITIRAKIEMPDYKRLSREAKKDKRTMHSLVVKILSEWRPVKARQ